MDEVNLIDRIIEKKQYRSYKVMSRGQFASTIEIDYKDKQKKTAVLIMTKKESEKRKFDFEEIQNDYTVKAIQYEYMCNLQSYLIYTETGECSLHDKVSDKCFRDSPKAIDSILIWIKQISMGLKKLHSTGFVHLNIRATSILIFSGNIAKLGCFDFARHSSTETERFETGSESYYSSPERFARNYRAFNGRKFDTWCLALLTAETLTKNYVARKSNNITTWSEQYAVLYKILQVKEFTKAVKKAYPKAAKGENLEKMVHLLKHTLKFDSEERPEIGEFLILLLELSFMKDIKKQLTEDKIWQKKVKFDGLQYKSRYVDLKSKASTAAEKTQTKYFEAFNDQMIIHEIEEDAQKFPPRLQAKIKKKKILTSGDGDATKTFSETFALKDEEIPKSEINEMDCNDHVMGDYAPDEIDYRNKDNSGFSFEHTDLHCIEVSSSEIENSMTENIQIVKPDPCEKVYAKDDLKKNTDENKLLSKRKNPVFQHSEVLPTDSASKDINLADKKDDVIICENEKHLNENIHDKQTRFILNTKGIIRKVVNWAFEEKFYSGVMHSESFINKLSQALTG